MELVAGGAGAPEGGPIGTGAPIGGRASHTQPTLLAMITTDSSGSPMFWQYSLHCAVESEGTGALLPTGAGHPARPAMTTATNPSFMAGTYTTRREHVARPGQLSHQRTRQVLGNSTGSLAARIFVPL